MIGAIAFTDLVGFTAYTARHGDASALELVDRHERVLADALPPGARAVKDLGDGLLLWFPDAASAVEACLEAVAAFGDGGLPALRAAVHWGDPAERAGDLVGHAVNVAARLVARAGPGEVLVSEEAWAEAAGRAAGVRFERLGRMALRGLPDPVWVVRARAGAPVTVGACRGPTPRRSRSPAGG